MSGYRSFFNDMTIPRSQHVRRVNALLREFPVVALLGARQVAKSTLARQVVEGRRRPCHWFDLEDPAHLLKQTPRTVRHPEQATAASRIIREGDLGWWA